MVRNIKPCLRPQFEAKTEMDDLEEGNHVTLNELVNIIDEEDELAQNADAVLGGSDDRNCTYLMVRFDSCVI